MSSRFTDLWAWTLRPIVAVLWGVLALVALVWYWGSWNVVYDLSGTDLDDGLVYHVGASALFVLVITLALARMWTTGRRRGILGILTILAAIGTYALFAFASATDQGISSGDDYDAWEELGMAFCGGVIVVLAFLTVIAILFSITADASRRIGPLHLSRNKGTQEF